MKATEFGLKHATMDKMNLVFARFNEIEEVIIYGSRAKGNFKNGSDLDLTIRGEKMDYKGLADLETQLDELKLPYTIDLSLHLKIASEELLEHIQSVGKIFWKR